MLSKLPPKQYNIHKLCINNPLIPGSKAYFFCYFIELHYISPFKCITLIRLIKKSKPFGNFGKSVSLLSTPPYEDFDMPFFTLNYRIAVYVHDKL